MLGSADTGRYATKFMIPTFWTRIKRYLLLAISLVVLSGCISPSPNDIWGTPEYFERITGVKFKEQGERYSCAHNPFPDVLMVRVVKIPSDILEYFVNPPESFRLHPKTSQRDDEYGYQVVKWKTGEPNEQDGILFKRLISGINSIKTSYCAGGYNGSDVAQFISDKFHINKMHFSYKVKSLTIGGYYSSISYFIIDPEQGYYIEMIDHD